ALDVFDRVLVMDPENERVLAILDRLNRRARLRTAAIALGGICVLAGGGYLVNKKMQPPAPEATTITPAEHAASGTNMHVANVESPPPPEEIDAGVTDATLIAVVTPTKDAQQEMPQIDAGPPPVQTTQVEVKVNPTGGRYRIAGGAWVLGD